MLHKPQKIFLVVSILLFMVTAIALFFSIPIVVGASVPLSMVLWVLGIIFTILTVLFIVTHTFYDSLEEQSEKYDR